MQIHQLQNQLLLEPFIDGLKESNNNIYFIGGCVRDSYLEIECKDIDLIVTGIDLEDLKKRLLPFGKTSLVGESFSVIKFTSEFSNIEYDIATPRIERKMSEGHKGFEVISNKNISLIDDQGRRDFNINSIAIDILTLEVFDPFNGFKDLKDKIIRVISENSFSDDPLRMLRCIMFSSRFNFTIEPETFELIKLNAHRIKEISSERILIEFEKIISKGDPKIGAELLISSGLYEQIFEKKSIHSDFTKFELVKTLGEFIYILYWFDEGISSANFYKNNLKGEIDTFKEMESLEILSVAQFHSSYGMIRNVIFKALQKSSNVINTKIYSLLDKFLDEFKSGLYPKSLKELAIDGNDLIELGFVGKTIGDMLQTCIKSILRDDIKNEKHDLIEFVISFKETNKILI